jgi:hypothetical protein
MIDLTNPEAKQGALAALDILKQSKLAPIRIKGGPGGGGAKLNMPKNVEEVTDDITDDELKQLDPDGEHGLNRADIARDELEQGREEILDQIKQDTEDRRAEVARANAREMERIKSETAKMGTVSNITNFGSDLQRAIKNQIRLAKKPEDSYLRPNATYAGSKYIMPGQKILEKRNKATINVYFDVSGSVSESALNLAKKTLASLDFYVRKGLVQYNIYYFADNVSADRSEAGGGTHAFPEILKHIEETKAKNVIIITDNDFNSQTKWNKCSVISIPGVMWWFWDNHQRATKAMPYIKSSGGLFQYWIE